MAEQETNAPAQRQTETPQAGGGAPQAAATATRPRTEDLIWGIGRRKKSIARVRIRPGQGKFLINERDVEEFFTEDAHRNTVVEPLVAVNMKSSWDVACKVDGGGITGQAGAICLGVARALAEAMPEVEHTLRDHGLLTRDARAKERKKYGQKGARKRFQFSKR